MGTLVIGGGGFVGLNVVEHLLAQGRAVTLFDIAPPPDAALTALQSLPGDLRLVTGDVREADTVAQAIGGDVDTMVYGAAVTAGMERDREAPEATMGVNLDGFLGALRAARDAGIRRVINLSSAGAYGAAAFRGRGPLSEQDEVADPQSIYSISKFASERVGDRMAEVWGLDVVSVRLSGVFGRWERRTSVRDTPSPHFQIVEALKAGKPAIVERLDERDWIYAPDVARAVDALLNTSVLSHRLYNVSTGQTWSVLAWGEAMAARFTGGVCRLAGPEEEANIMLHAPSDRRPLCVEKIRKDVTFPVCYDIDQSVEDYHGWLRLEGADYR
ncbi:MAG: NAD(P)-dependent oxidoreductase [Proteobacteria bacterium]|nr:NAD(P)-dependent oxidoreductase [Pseudomonadota bacterium]